MGANPILTTMIRVKVHQPIDYIYAFLQTRGFLLVEDKPQVLHYTNSDTKDLESILKSDKPDLAIIHINPVPKDILKKLKGWIYVIHTLQIPSDLTRPKKLWTNSFRMCQHYYQKLGIQAEINIVPQKQEKSGSQKINLSGAGQLLTGFRNRFFAYMLWR